MTTDECHAETPSLKHKRSRSKSLVRARKRRIHQQRHHPTCAPHISYPRTPRPPSLFETYITSQSFLPPHEHHAFFTTLRRPLPLCFRIRSISTLHEWHSLLHTLPPHDATTSIQRLPLHAPHTYQLPSHLPDLYPKLRHWITSRTRGGQISRQEYVSMIPVHLLSIQSHHRVLDLCASPGSKTIQALDALYDSHHMSGARGGGGGGGGGEEEEEEETTVPLGFVMANELDVRRAYVLAHRTRETLKERMVSMAVVTHNACRFPNVLAPCRRVHGQQPQQQQQQHGGINSSPSSPKPFDRIICDVPCSGDGTLRKDTKIYKTWHPSYVMTLHSLQLRIAKRGIALLHVGGYMTYSTCSFHPVENEAVVAALLLTGCVQLVHGTELVGPKGLEGVRYREGLSSWKVLNDECTILQRDSEEGKEWPDTLWPPREEGIARVLKRCIRMVPQDNDTGGFFIALLKKVKDFDDSSKNGGSRKDVMVTPQMPCHRLYECSNVESPSQEKCRYFVRSQGGSTSISKSKTFKLSRGLADYLCDQQGSSKLNLVYAGHAMTQPTDHDKK
eukprot:CCRYP_020250-RA/>CCRYP_020250-RA protein AED:0.28 eAED:0.28 QI:0/-1/0/1/-1/1/1/0/559